jgi:hypothetical protein
VKREHESIDLRAQKMMRFKVQPFVVLIVVKVVPIMTYVAKQIAEIP